MRAGVIGTIRLCQQQPLIIRNYRRRQLLGYFEEPDKLRGTSAAVMTPGNA
jgi:hypothetical protein